MLLIHDLCWTRLSSTICLLKQNESRGKPTNTVNCIEQCGDRIQAIKPILHYLHTARPHLSTVNIYIYIYTQSKIGLINLVKKQTISSKKFPYFLFKKNINKVHIFSINIYLTMFTSHTHIHEDKKEREGGEIAKKFIFSIHIKHLYYFNNSLEIMYL